MDFDRAEQVLRALEREGVRYAVFGGAALNFHGIARFTEDVDLFIAPERENIDRLRAALHFEISVVSPRTLYRMKRNTVRLKDRADAELLRDRFRLEDD